MNSYHKICNQCKILNPITEFSRNKSRKDGHQYYCKTCEKKYRDNNKDASKLYHKKYSEDNRQSLKEYHKKYYENNKETLLENVKLYEKTRYSNDELYATTKRIRALVRQSVNKQGYSKKSKTHEILGCSFDEFKTHIENQFLEGMTWDNRSEWHLDHIIPVSWGETEEEIIALNHYTNFQPLWAIDNRRKGNKFT